MTGSLRRESPRKVALPLRRRRRPYLASLVVEEV
jgi:hypothetical protein